MPRKSRRPVVLAILGGVVVVVGLVAGLFVRDLLVVRSSLQEARASLTTLRASIGDIDVDAARAELARADAALGRARSRSAGPLWSLLGRVPVAGDDVRMVRGIVKVASTSLDVAREAVTEGGDLLGAGLEVQLVDAQLDLAPLLQAHELVAGLPIDRLAAAREELLAVPPGWSTPGELREARAETLSLADDALGTVERADALLSALPGFLGQDGPRRYFVGAQTPAEIRGTGGLIGYWMVLEVDEGRFELLSSSVYDAEDDVVASGPATGRIGELSGDRRDGVEASEEFERRYGHVAATGMFSNVNVDPDLPTTARVALDLFHKRTGDRLDGMILVDPYAMQGLLEAIGRPLDLTAQELPDGAPERIAPEDFVDYVTVDVYDRFGHGQQELRKPLLRAIGDATFDNLFGGSWDGVAVSRALGDAAGGRHLQLFSEVAGEQDAFVTADVAGAFGPAPGADLLAVTANNAVGGKQDVHLTYRTTAEITFGEPGLDEDDEVVIPRLVDVEVGVVNPLPSEGLDLYIIGNCAGRRLGQPCFHGPPGENRTWFSVWAAGGSRLVWTEQGDAPALQVGGMHGFRVFDRYLDTPSESEASFRFLYDGVVPGVYDGREVTYRLTWWAQAAPNPHEVELRFVPPEGWSVVVGEPGRNGPSLEAIEGDDGVVTLSGDLDRDVTVELRLRGSS